MSKHYFALLFIAFSCSFYATGQSTGINYNYTTGANSWVANSLPVIIIPASTDDQLVNISGAAFPATWSGFDYAGITFTSVTGLWISSNGFLSVQSPGTSIPNNSLAS